jgi:hypothetical protein
MNFIEEIDGVISTTKKYGGAHVGACCKGIIYSSKGFKFRYSDNIGLIRNRKKTGSIKGEYKSPKARKAYQYDAITGDFIKECRCYSDASEEIGFSPSYILSVISGKYKSIGDYIFKWEKFDKVEPVKFLENVK